MRVLDSTTMFTCQAVLVREAVRLVKEEQKTVAELQEPLEAMRDSIRAYVIPEDLYYLHTRASTKGDNSVGLLSYKLGNMLNVKPIIQCVKGETSPCDKASGFDKALNRLFDRVEQAIEKGLRTPFIAMSYAGDLSEMRNYECYQRFQVLAQGLNIETMLSVMSTTAGINVGPRSFSLAYAER
ncbi:MAG: DegV family protein [Pseudomonadota bacterium]